MILKQAKNIADEMIERLRPTCERIEIAGSVRREKTEPNDIEIVAIPILKAPRPEFGEREIFKTSLDRLLARMRRGGLIEVIKGGEKYKQFWKMNGGVHVIKIDLFLVTPPAQWGVIDVIRTGPDDFSHWMVTQRHKGGALVDGFRVQEGIVLRGEEKTPHVILPLDGSLMPMPEEIDFFRFCGLEWIEPSKRQAEWRMRNE